MFDQAIDSGLRELVAQWNIAEQRIKKAEQVRGGEVVASAIFELRYAGRKIVDCLDIITQHDILKDSSRYNLVRSFLDDATEDCVKAKHDAIDAMISFVTVWLDEAEKRISLSKLQSLFPDYIDVTNRIYDTQDKIAQSRGERVKSRDAIYNEIDNGDFAKILALYDKIKRSQPRFEAEIRKGKINFYAMWVVTIISLIVGVVGTVYGFMH